MHRADEPATAVQICPAPSVPAKEAASVVPSRVESDWHRKMAAKLFNATWDLIGKKHRTKEEVDAMIHMAHASRYHWGVVGGPKEFAIGEWQISRVYAVLDRPEPSLFHAQRSLEICEARHVNGFPLAYAYEALARAFAIAGKARLRDACMKLAKTAGEKIEEAEDRTQFFKDLRTVPRAKHR